MEYQNPAPNPVPVQNQVQYQPVVTNQETPMSVGEWFVTILITALPIVGIIMVFVWAFSSTEKKSKSNYFKAMLIWAVIAIVLSILFAIFMASVFTALIKSITDSMSSGGV